MKRSSMTLAMAVLVMAGGLPSAMAQDPQDQEVVRLDGGRWEVNAFGGVVDDRPEFEAPRGRFAAVHEGVIGARVSYGLSSSVFLEGDLGYTPVVIRYNVGGRRTSHNLQAVMLGGVIGYNLHPLDGVEVFALGGLGTIRWSDHGTNEFDLVFDLGGGGRYFLTPWAALRTDARLHYVPSALKSTRRALRPDLRARGRSLWLPEVSGGFSFFLGAMR